MKTILVICLCMVLLITAGCWTNQYVHRIYDANTGNIAEEWTFDYAKAMMTSTVTDVNLYISDGSFVQCKKSIIIYDGNDWIKMGEGVKKGASPFMIFW